MNNDHLTYWAFVESSLNDALVAKYRDDTAKIEMIKEFLYSNAAQTYKLFHTNETIGLDDA